MKKIDKSIKADGVSADGKSEGWYSYLERDWAYFRRDNSCYSDSQDGGRGFPVHDVWDSSTGTWEPYEGDATAVALEGSYVTRAKAEAQGKPKG